MKIPGKENLNPWEFEYKDEEGYSRSVRILPNRTGKSPECRWFAMSNLGVFYWKTKKSARENLNRIVHQL